MLRNVGDGSRDTLGPQGRLLMCCPAIAAPAHPASGGPLGHLGDEQIWYEVMMPAAPLPSPERSQAPTYHPRASR